MSTLKIRVTEETFIGLEQMVAEEKKVVLRYRNGQQTNYFTGSLAGSLQLVQKLNPIWVRYLTKENKCQKAN